MARSIDRKCLACAALSADEAQQLRGDRFKPKSGSISIHRFQNCCCEVVSEAQDFRAVLLTKAVTSKLIDI